MELIIVGGQTSTGKSTLARQLRDDLQIDAFLKDEYKEQAMDELPNAGPIGWARFERQAWDALYEKVRTHAADNTDLLIEGNFAGAQRRRLSTLLAGQVAVEVFCHADPAVVFQRYVQRNRSGERHPGHHDHLWYGLVWVEGLCARLGWRWIKPLKLGPRLLQVDTTDFSQVNYDSIRTFVSKSS